MYLRYFVSNLIQNWVTNISWILWFRELVDGADPIVIFFDSTGQKSTVLLGISESYIHIMVNTFKQLRSNLIAAKC